MQKTTKERNGLKLILNYVTGFALSRQSSGQGFCIRYLYLH